MEVGDLSRSLKFYRSLRILTKRRGTMSHGGKWVHLIDADAQQMLEQNRYPSASKFVRSIEMEVNLITSASSLMMQSNGSIYC